MRNETGSSVFYGLKEIEYFRFEEDFVEKNVRCIPMIVRFKMDAVGIKLKLAEWSRFEVEERIELALKPCDTVKEVSIYKEYLAHLVYEHTGREATEMSIDLYPSWSVKDVVPASINEKAVEFGYYVSTEQWQTLTDLQRFALMKLSKDGHENKNFPKAINEFGLAIEKVN